MMAIMFWPGGAPWPVMDINRWLLVPATIVQFVLGRRFLVAAARGARHGEANDEHAGRDRHAGRLRLLGLRHPPARDGDGRRARPRDVLRLGRADHRPRPASVAGSRHAPRDRPPAPCKALLRAAAADRTRPASRWRARRARRARSSSATCCGCAPAIAFRSMASSSTARPRSTSRCSPASRSRSTRPPATG